MQMQKALLRWLTWNSQGIPASGPGARRSLWRGQRWEPIGNGCNLDLTSIGIMSGAAITVGFVGLGAMGAPMASHIARAFPGRTCVWNRTSAVAEAHAEAHGSRACADVGAVFDSCSVIVLCLPTSDVVAAVLADVAGRLRSGQVVIDCTSGDPTTTQSLSDLYVGREEKRSNPPCCATWWCGAVQCSMR